LLSVRDVRWYERRRRMLATHDCEPEQCQDEERRFVIGTPRSHQSAALPVVAPELRRRVASTHARYASPSSTCIMTEPPMR
jgi:hypothetical protein